MFAKTVLTWESKTNRSNAKREPMKLRLTQTSQNGAFPLANPFQTATSKNIFNTRQSAERQAMSTNCQNCNLSCYWPTTLEYLQRNRSRVHAKKNIRGHAGQPRVSRALIWAVTQSKYPDSPVILWASAWVTWGSISMFKYCSNHGLKWECQSQSQRNLRVVRMPRRKAGCRPGRVSSALSKVIWMLLVTLAGGMKDTAGTSLS